MASISTIFNIARTYLGDLNETRYSDLALSKAMEVALHCIYSDIGSSIEYAFDTQVITPTPSKEVINLIGTAIAFIIVLGEETSTALDYGGVVWKSGISSLDLSGYNRSVSNVAKNLREAYLRFLSAYNMTSDQSKEIDLYSTTIAGNVDVN